jgi:hypothetical protein
MTILMTFPGVVVITARGGEVAMVEGGKPVEGKKSYRVEGHKSLAYDASVWLRLTRDGKPVVIGARSVHTGVRPGIDQPEPLGADWSLEWLIFDALKCDPAKAHVRDLVEPKPEAMTPEQIRDEACDKRAGFERVRDLYRIAHRSHFEGTMLIGDTGDEEDLLKMLVRIGNERNPAAQAAEPAAEAKAAPRTAQPASANGHGGAS